MQINLIIFGQLCEILDKNLVLNNIADTNDLTRVLHEKYPALKNSKYIMAVDKKVVTENITLPQYCTVALLPPFSGG
jgi:molybdopterin converting factor small subunit